LRFEAMRRGCATEIALIIIAAAPLDVWAYPKSGAARLKNFEESHLYVRYRTEDG